MKRALKFQNTSKNTTGGQKHNQKSSTNKPQLNFFELQPKLMPIRSALPKGENTTWDAFHVNYMWK